MDNRLWPLRTKVIENDPIPRIDFGILTMWSHPTSTAAKPLKLEVTLEPPAFTNSCQIFKKNLY